MTPSLPLSSVTTLLRNNRITRLTWPRLRKAFSAFHGPQVDRPIVWVGASAALVLATAGGIYALFGGHADGVAAAANGAPLSSAATGEALAASGNGALARAESRINNMVAGLAERMKTRPNDAQGWHTLGTSYAALGRHALAVAAYRSALRLRPNDAALLADYAYSAAVLDPHAESSDAASAVAKALQLNPVQPKALKLAGTLALDRKDYRSAIAHWTRLARIEPAGSAAAVQLQSSIRQAQHLAALSGLALSVPPLEPVLLAAPGAPVQAQVSGTVTLAPSLVARVSPDDFVYVFARAVSGPRVPLAMLRKQVKDLPLRFTLDESLATSPAATLANARSVVVSALVARHGSAVARNGDLQGQLPAMPVGRSDLKVEIDEVVKVR